MKATMSAPGNAVSEPRVSVLRAESGHRTARRSRLASFGLVLILLGVSVFAVWSSQATSRAARAASLASRLSDDYADAATAVAAEESLERKYRLEPGPDVQARYAAAAGMLVNALALVRRDGDAADRARVDQLLVPHTAYLAAMDRMFRATDRGDTAAVLKIDGSEVDPSFGAIQKTVDDAAKAQHHKSLGQLAHLERMERLTGRLPPVAADDRAERGDEQQTGQEHQRRQPAGEPLHALQVRQLTQRLVVLSLGGVVDGLLDRAER